MRLCFEFKYLMLCFSEASFIINTNRVCFFLKKFSFQIVRWTIFLSRGALIRVKRPYSRLHPKASCSNGAGLRLFSSCKLILYSWNFSSLLYGIYTVPTVLKKPARIKFYLDLIRNNADIDDEEYVKIYNNGLTCSEN